MTTEQLTFTGVAPAVYERNQSFNPIVRYLHSFRFNYLLELVGEIASTGPLKVVEIGCAGAKSFGLLNSRFAIDYTGIELNEGFCAEAQARYGTQDNFTILKGSVESYLDALDGADVILAMETLEHIPESLVVRIVEKIAEARPRLFLCSVPNEVGPMIWIKNLGSAIMGYNRHRSYSWRDTFFAGIARFDKLPVHYNAHNGFDWRWLAHTIVHNLHIRRYLTTPLRRMPRFLSPTIVFVCEPYSSPPKWKAAPGR